MPIRPLFNPLRLRIGVFLFLLSVTLFSSSCGIDNYLYLYPVTQVNTSGTTYISWYLPSTQVSGYFKYYRIYYRLYKSHFLATSSIAPGDFNNINTTLYSDYTKIAPYFNLTTNAPVYVQSIFEDQLHYLELSLEGTSLSNVLNDSLLGSSLKIAFDFSLMSPNTVPVLVLYGLTYTNYYTLLRSVVSPTPLTDKGHFFYSDLLYNSTTDADIVADTTTGTNTYIYACFYIVAVGKDDNGSTVLSTPTLLGVVPLPPNS
jgi:hypothetical protein